MRVISSVFDQRQSTVDRRNKKNLIEGKQSDIEDDSRELNHPRPTDREVRERVSKHRQSKIRLRSMEKKQQGGKEIEGEYKLESDIKLNDPHDPTTIGKLKKLLEDGGFNFSEKERQVLGNILADQ